MVNDNDRELMETPAFQHAMRETQVMPAQIEPMELTAWSPRLRVECVSRNPAFGGNLEKMVNEAAAALESAGHTIIGFQFETWVTNESDMNDCCWITYALAADDEGTITDGDI